MSYLALYRKYRSRTFDEIIGQDHVTKTLKNQIVNDKIAHAYLLCGIRGTGKTSIAKILGKAVNCTNSKDGNPCLECEMCKGIDKGEKLNVIEIDAASNNGVEDVKEIRNDVLYTPTDGRFKVYIIDEVHMLSISAFNALLKVIEEPPKHVIFILATTEFQKIPATILSRCQRFDLKRIAKDIMIERIKEYLEIENIKVEDKAISYIASLSEGSMRDALSILEQVISIKVSEEVTLDDVLNTLGNVDYNVYHKLTDSLKNKNAKDAIEIVNEIYENGKEIKSFVVNYITYLRNLLLIMNASNAADILDMSEDNIKQIKELASSMSSTMIIQYIEEFAKVEAEMRYSNMPKLIVEIAIIKLCKEAEVMVRTVVENAVQVQSSSNATVQSQGSISKPAEVSAPAERKVENLGDEELLKKWKNVIEKTEGSLRAFLLKTKATKIVDNNFYVLVQSESVKTMVSRNKKLLESYLPLTDKGDMNIIFYTNDDLSSNKAKEVETNNMDDIVNSLSGLGIQIDVK